MDLAVSPYFKTVCMGSSGLRVDDHPREKRLGGFFLVLSGKVREKEKKGQGRKLCYKNLITVTIVESLFPLDISNIS